MNRSFCAKPWSDLPFVPTAFTSTPLMAAADMPAESSHSLALVAGYGLWIETPEPAPMHDARLEATRE